MKFRKTGLQFPVAGGLRREWTHRQTAEFRWPPLPAIRYQRKRDDDWWWQYQPPVLYAAFSWQSSLWNRYIPDRDNCRRLRLPAAREKSLPVHRWLRQYHRLRCGLTSPGCAWAGQSGRAFPVCPELRSAPGDAGKDNWRAPSAACSEAGLPALSALGVNLYGITDLEGFLCRLK